MDKLSVIVPCYRCGSYIEANFAELQKVEELFEKGSVETEYVFVDDGSDDNTLEVLRRMQESRPTKVKVVQLARNFGAHNAVMSGLYFAEGDYFAVIAADLQEPPEVIAQMLKISSEGYRIVLGERKNIDNPFFAKITSRIFHAIMRALIFRKAPAKGFDFFMIDNVVRETILRMFERNTNLLYLLIWTGYPYALVEYNKSRRKFGKSQWTLRKKIDLFFDTLFAFTLLPLRLLGAVGLLFLPTGLGLLGFEFSRGNFHHAALTNGLLLFLAGSILLGINILGEYLWRVTAEVKGRPIFLVNEYFEKKEEEPKRGKLGFFSDRKNEDTKESQS